MKIIETRSAPNPRRVRMFLSEKGIDVPFEEMDMMQGAAQTPEFTAGNPWQRVPVLVLDDGTWISETVAICRYFEAVQPQPPLFGDGARQQAIVEMWNRRMELGLLQSIAHVFRHLHPKMAHLEVPQVPAWGEANRPKVVENLRRLEAQLAQSACVAGPQFTIADITAYIAIGFMKPAKLQVPDEFVNIRRWLGHISNRPSSRA
jgi:glutathione S-transferase